jgi:hypothetical protein
VLVSGTLSIVPSMASMLRIRNLRLLLSLITI